LWFNRMSFKRTNYVELICIPIQQIHTKIDKET